ncbi:MAG: hypothetical protein J6D15_05955 [Clostridia bacterium]|nr:hypothetical protein [Clostridia bacterium]
MKKFKIIALMLVFVLSLQCVAFANVQPRGRYLLGGGCSITPYSGYVIVTGHTDAYEDVDKLIVEVTVFKEVSPGCWIEFWSDSLSTTDDSYVRMTNTRVNVDNGYRYMVEATHTVKHGNVTETNYSETNYVIVY